MMYSSAGYHPRVQVSAHEAVASEYVDNLVHELGTPLTVLLGYLHAARYAESHSQHTHDCFERIEQQCERMHRIIRELQDLSLLAANPEAPRDERVDVMEVLAQVRAEAQVLSANRHRIVLDAAAGLDVLGAASDIACAFRNLVGNAIRYTPHGGEVRLLWRAVPHGAEFVVEDSGIGIAEEHLPRLTERFYRVARTRPGNSGGAGLGLAIVKGVLDRHEAILEIRSTPGQGSAFTVRFPPERIAPVRPGHALHFQW